MSRRFVVFSLLVSAMTVHAAAIPVGTIVLDSSPTPFFGDYSWEYTISVTGGNLGELSSITVDDVYGVTGLFTPGGWSSSDTALGGDLFDVTFTNNNHDCGDACGTSRNGFYILSTSNTEVTQDYTVDYHDVTGNQPSPNTVTVPGNPDPVAPEPATLGLTGLSLLALGGIGARRRSPKR